MFNKSDCNDIVEFQVRRAFATVAKRILILFEDLKEDHANNFDKLYQAFPEDAALINMSDYLDAAQFTHLRKRILDIVGDSGRELQEEVKKYKIELL